MRLLEALEDTPQAKWATSNKVARAYLESPKVKGILKHLGFKMRVPESLYPDVMQNTWVVLARALPTLDKASNVYSYIYATVYLCICSLRTNSKKTETLQTENENADDSGESFHATHYEMGAHEDHASDAIRNVDMIAAQKNFALKRLSYEWPDDIISDSSLYGRIGRPRKATQDASP
jgi:hypothetical protein